jgi:hypothetical protein
MTAYTGSMDENEDEARKRYGYAPVGTPRIAKRHRLVLTAMRDQCDRNGRGTVCASVNDLVKLTGLSVAGVSFARNDLRRWGYVEVVSRAAGSVPATWRVVAEETSDEFLRRAGVRMP